MQQPCEVDISPDATAFLIRGGHPRGGDDLHRLVSSWPGWRRIPATGTLPNFGPCSVYRGPAWPSAVMPLLNSNLQATWTEKARNAALEIRKDLQTAKACLVDKTRMIGFADDLPRTPFLHQENAVAAAAPMYNRFLLTDDMGLGKTATALWSWWMTCPDRFKGSEEDQKAFRRLLVLCPKTSKYNWRAEVAKNIAQPEELPCYIIDGTPRQR